MQDILSFVKAPSPITLAPSTNEPAKTEGTFTENFFSIILGQITAESKQASLDAAAQALPITTQSEANTNLTTIDQKAKSVDEHLLEDLLSVVNALQQNSQTTVFPTLKPSSTLEKILGSEIARQDFSNVKSVSDLMDLSKKYNLGLEKLSISQESLDNLQTKFPKLAQNNFFNDLQTALSSAQSSQKSDATLPQTTTNNVMNLLDKQSTQTETTPVTSILSELFSKDIKPKTTQTTASNNVANTPIVDTTPSDTTQQPLMVNEKQQNTLAQALQTPQEEVIQAAPIEAIIQKVVNTNETKKLTTPTQTTDTAAQDEPVQIQVASTHVNEVKKEPLVKTSEETIDATLKTVKVDKAASDAASTGEEITQTQKVAKPEEKETPKAEEAQTTVDIKTDIKTTAKQEVSTNKSIPVKETFSQFATDLKERIEAYKPPLMKVELSLNPKNLGDVDVTLLTRGNNLHVNISSTTNTMSLFTQNQNDVKDALINMGFTNLEMNFSDQRQSNQNQQNQKQSSGNPNEFTTEPTEENTAQLEIVIPQYV